jgi:hypothetical protein
MSSGTKSDRKHSTVVLGVLVALGVIAFLAGAEFVFERWVSPGANGGPFYSSNGPTRTPDAASPAVATTTRGGSSGQSAEPQSPGTNAISIPPVLKPKGCKSTDAPCGGGHPRTNSRKPPANEVAQLRSPAPPNVNNSSAPPDGAQQSNAGSPGANAREMAAQDARAAEEKLRATEEAAAQLVALEREELDHLSDRTRAMNDRVDALQRQQPAPDLQRRTDLAFSQQRLQSYLAQAGNALKGADVQSAKMYLDQARAELEKLGKLVGR